ncbi:hypothetical protein OSB04_030993 [Centaurea solstitialis]|uniref:Uncharacterized protein n=1 Tax=Centaurea solstitialis TaxID=347529 RepID=A0AA38S8P0_9ASTR|nr:hypothetical protein OSB04_030993 [Centaurea solstitialis]
MLEKQSMKTVAPRVSALAGCYTNPLSKPYGGVIEQLFHQFSQEQGKMGADAEQKMQGFVNFVAGLHKSTDQFLRDVKETFPHMEAETQSEVFTTTRR